MNERTGGRRGARSAGALAVMAAVVLLTAACSVVHVHFGSPAGSHSIGPATYQEELAYAQCMRTHGLPGFPSPKPSEGLGTAWHLNGGPGSPAARANDACEHLLSPASTTAPATLGRN
jgi:hypothetical protein